MAHRRAPHWWALIGLCALCACSQPPAPAPAPHPYDFELIIAEAPQREPPALWVGDQVGIAAWVGSDEAGVHIDARTFSGADGALQPAAVLPLPPRRPTALSLHPTSARGGTARARLLWLDADDSGAIHLFSALIGGIDSGRLTVERGPIRVSDRPVRDYAAAFDGFGRLWTVWRGGLASEPALYLHLLDTEARPSVPQMIAADAGAFALAADGAGLHLFWVDRAANQVMHTAIIDGVVTHTHPLTNAPALAPADRLLSLRVGIDRLQGCLFWQIERWNGGAPSFEVWWTAGGLSRSDWTTPVRMDARAAAPFSAYPPMETLLIALDSGSALQIRPCRTGGMGALVESQPSIAWLYPPYAMRRGDQLYLAWSEPFSESAARLMIRKITLTP
jgi:hypothetical protein